MADLEQKVQEENAMRFSLEVQVNKMRYELEVIKTGYLFIMKDLSYCTVIQLFVFEATFLQVSFKNFIDLQQNSILFTDLLIIF